MGKTHRASGHFKGRSQQRQIHRHALRSYLNTLRDGGQWQAIPTAERAALWDPVWAHYCAQWDHWHANHCQGPAPVCPDRPAKRRFVAYDGHSFAEHMAGIAATYARDFARAHRDGHQRVFRPYGRYVENPQGPRVRMRNRLANLVKNPEAWDDGFDPCLDTRMIWDPYY